MVFMALIACWVHCLFVRLFGWLVVCVFVCLSASVHGLQCRKINTETATTQIKQNKQTNKQPILFVCWFVCLFQAFTDIGFGEICFARFQTLSQQFATFLNILSRFAMFLQCSAKFVLQCLVMQQTNKQTNKHKQPTNQTNKQPANQPTSQTNTQTNKQPTKQTHKQINKQTHK